MGAARGRIVCGWRFFVEFGSPGGVTGALSIRCKRATVKLEKHKEPVGDSVIYRLPSLSTFVRTRGSSWGPGGGPGLKSTVWLGKGTGSEILP